MKEDKKLRLFVVSHKDVDRRLYPGRDFIFVGPNSDKLCKEGDYKDNTGINIADKNYTYCEMTAIYYLYKNFEDYDYIGIEHYRRLFGFPSYLRLNHFSTKYLLKKAKRSDILIMNRFFSFKSNKKQWADNHDIKYLDTLREVIKEIEPTYLDSFDKAMNNHHIALCNMFITNKEVFKKYCDFVFKVLFEVEKRIEIPKDPYQRRIMGFLSERLLDCFVIKNKLKISYTYVCLYNKM